VIKWQCADLGQGSPPSLHVVSLLPEWRQRMTVSHVSFELVLGSAATARNDLGVPRSFSTSPIRLQLLQLIRVRARCTFEADDRRFECAVSYRLLVSAA